MKSLCGWVVGQSDPEIIHIPYELGEEELHFTFMREAIQLSSDAEKHGNHPFGAILVYEDPKTRHRHILLKAENLVHTNSDATQHAELRLVSDANQDASITKEMLKNSILYTSSEPCAMCAGAIFWSGIRKVVYAAPHDTFGSASFRVPCREVFKYARKSADAHNDESVVVIGPVLADESVPIVSNYFKDKF